METSCSLFFQILGLPAATISLAHFVAVQKRAASATEVYLRFSPGQPKYLNFTRRNTVITEANRISNQKFVLNAFLAKFKPISAALEHCQKADLRQ